MVHTFCGRVLLIAACLVLSRAVPAAPVENPVVPGGGFETALAPWTLTDGDGAQHRVSLDKVTKHAGESSLRLEKTNAAGFVQLQSAPVAVQAETSYRVSAWLDTVYADKSRETPSLANVYFMVSQFKPGSEEMDLPNIFGPVRPFLSSGGQWEKLEMSFATRAGVDRVRISLVVAGDTADLLVDDVALEVAGREEYKPRYEPPTPEKLMSQAEAEKILRARPRATAQVRRVGERPRLFLDGKESFPGFYLGAAWQGKNSQIGDFQRAGVRVFLIPYVLGRGVYGDFGVWSGPNQTDFSEVDEMLWRVLRADPQAYIMFYLATDPYPNWGAEHPDAILTNEKGEKAIVDMHFLRWDTAPPKVIPNKPYVERYGHSYVAQELRQETGEVLRRFDQHIKNSLPGKAVIGYHVIGGNDGQMFQWDDFVADSYSDYSLASLRAFREWLKAEYSTDAALQKAWRRTDVTFETAAIPDAKRRATERLFLDRPEDRDIVDFNRFRSEGIVDTLDGYARVLRQSHETPIILGTYYAGPATRVRSHHATGYLLKNGLFNYVASVLTYGEIRWPGGPGKAHQAWGSLLLHNVFGLAEEDFRSWKTRPSTPQNDFHVARVQTAEESNAMIRRDTGHMLALGQGNWWYDMSGGWFSDPSIMKAVEESVRGYQADLHDDARPRADVAVFIDEKSLNYTASPVAGTLEYNAINRQVVAMNSSGVPYHTYLQEDLANPQLPDYKLYVFLNAYHLTPAEWSALQKLRRGGKTLAFVYAPGAVAGDVLSTRDAAQSIAKITGITVQAHGVQKPVLETVPGNALYSASTLSYANFPLPVFAVTDTEARAVAKYPDGQTAVAYRDFGAWKSLFFGGVGMNEFFFNALAKKAGAWVAAPAGNAVYGSQHFLTIHAMYPGEKKVQLLEPTQVTDLADGSVLAQSTRSLTLPMQRGETRWFHLQK